MDKSSSDSLDLFELLTALWVHRWVGIAVGALVTAAGIAYALLATPVYRAEVVLSLNQSEPTARLPSSLSGLVGLAGLSLGAPRDATQAVATLRSRAFVEEFIEDNNLMPVLFKDKWDQAKQWWAGDDEEKWPDIRDGIEYFVEDVRYVVEEPDTGLVTLAVEWTDPEQAAAWVRDLVVRINEHLRERDLQESRRRLEYLNRELEKATLVELRQAISGLIEEQIQTIMLAQGEAEYAFRVIDPPRVPKRPHSPNRVVVVAIAAVLGLFLGGMSALWMWSSRRRSLASIAQP